MTSMARRITFGDDHSPGADVAWGWISAQDWDGWSVDVVTVTEPDPAIESLFMHEALHDYTPDRPRVAPQSARISTIRHLTTAYDPRIVLSENENAGLIVVGARGKGLLKSMHIGSTAEWLMRCPTTPVVIAREAQQIRSILACVDGSRHARAAVDVLARMPWITDCRVDVISVIQGDEDIRVSAREAADVLAEVGARPSVQVVDVEPTALTLNPKYRILDAIDTFRPDLVVLGTRGRTGVPRLLVGSVAGAVAHAAPGSVLLARDVSEDLE